MDQTSGYLFAGGGTGGHLFPGLAVACALRDMLPDVAIHFMGSDRPSELGIVRSFPFEHFPLPVRAPGEWRRRPIGMIRENFAALRQASQVIDRIQPRVVIGLGGYISAPALWTARRRGIPIVLMEQNAIVGAATRWFARSARRICLSYPKSVSNLEAENAVFTGNPVRSSFQDLTQPAHHSSARQLLILGGSLGARSVNRAMLQALQMFLKEHPWPADWTITHQAGASDCESMRAEYSRLPVPAEVHAFLEDLPNRLLESQLVVSRAGGTTLAELACAGTPSLLLPLPSAKDDHQTANARYFSDRQAAILIRDQADPAATARELCKNLEDLLCDEAKRMQLGNRLRDLAIPDAAQQVSCVILEVAS